MLFTGYRCQIRGLTHMWILLYELLGTALWSLTLNFTAGGYIQQECFLLKLISETVLGLLFEIVKALRNYDFLMWLCVMENTPETSVVEN